MDPVTILTAFLAGYLPGAISFARIVTKIIKPDADLSTLNIPVEGTDEKIPMSAMGGTAVAMVLGRRAGCLVGLLDMIKVAAPVLIIKYAFPEQPYHIISAIAGLIGHNWPVFYGFKGGRGVSAVYGGMFAVDWLGAIVTSSVGMIVGMGVLKDFLVAYLAGLWLMIPWMIWRNWGWEYIVYAVALNILFMLAMLPEIVMVMKMKKKLKDKVDLTMMMRTVPMGQMMLEWSQKLRFKKQK